MWVHARRRTILLAAFGRQGQIVWLLRKETRGVNPSLSENIQDDHDQCGSSSLGGFEEFEKSLTCPGD